MATEASKTRAIWGEEIHSLLRGEGIDIGCGSDPIIPGVQRFDREHGDAGRVRDFVKRDFDFVFSSHCLEHLEDPRSAIEQWFSLVRPGGHLIVIVPDEDLYEQGAFPSLFNGDHRWTFTLSKARSWSPRSINVLDLAHALEKAGGRLVDARLHDHGIDRRLLAHRPSATAAWLGRVFRRLHARFPRFEGPLVALFRRLGAAIDQTGLSDARLAQIQLVVQRSAKA